MTKSAATTPGRDAEWNADEAQEDAGHAPGELTPVESVVTAVTGMAIGGASLWFLAPICLVC